MKKKTKKLNFRPLFVLIVFLVIVAAIVATIMGIVGRNGNEEILLGQTEEQQYFTVLNDGGRKNTSKEVNKTKTVNNLEISNISLVERGGVTTLLADVKNTSNQESEKHMVGIQFVDKDGNSILETATPVEKLVAGQETGIELNISADLANVYDMHLSIM